MRPLGLEDTTAFTVSDLNQKAVQDSRRNLRGFAPRARQAVSPCFRAGACAALRFASAFPLTLQGWVIPLSLRFLPPPLAAAGRGAVHYCTTFTKGNAKT